MQPTGDNYYIGDEAVATRGVLNLSYPTTCGVITDFDDMELIWDDVFKNQLKVSPEAQPVCITEYPLNPSATRAKIAEVMFEKFKVPSLHIASTSKCALKSTDKTTGVVVDIGATQAIISHYIDGKFQPTAFRKVLVGGSEITDFMCELLQQECGTGFTTSAERDIVRDIKEKHGYISQNYDSGRTFGIGLMSYRNEACCILWLM